MSTQVRKRLLWSLFIGLTAVTLLTVMVTPQKSGWGGYQAIDAVSAATAPGMSVVSVVRSDNERLKEPTGPNSTLTETQVENMVRLAVAWANGLAAVIPPDAAWVVIKPDIAELKASGSGVVTDYRVVKAVVKMVHETAPDARITIVEGPSSWISPGHPEVKNLFRTQVGDGFEVAGYRKMVKDLEQEGIEADIADLNFDESAEVEVPEGGLAKEKYWVPKTILECDALIDVPVMKVTSGVGMAAALENSIGIAPGNKYGWDKNQGYPPASGTGLYNTLPMLDKVIVDLTVLANVKFTVVDAIMCMERGKSDAPESGGRPVQMNAVAASRDIVAADAVCARLMGFNPDDFEFLTSAQYKGLGTMETAKIKINGNDISKVIKRFEKPPADKGEAQERGHYGQGVRTWLLRGPFPLAIKDAESIDPKTEEPVSGKNGWSESAYFNDDKIDFNSYYKRDLTDCVVYAYTSFTVPKADSLVTGFREAELWVGSSKSLTVWVNGEKVYSFRGTRQHKLSNEKLKIRIKEGTGSLLVRADQTKGPFDFSVNICEVESDERYSGNRLAGLEFQIPGAEPAGSTTDQGEE